MVFLPPPGAAHPQVEFVALVHSDTATSTSINYELGDGTGYVEVRQWLDSADDEAGKGDGATQDKYVMVIGNLKVFQNKRQITAQHLRVVEDPDEIHHHLLKALSVSLALRGGTSNGRGVSGTETLLTAGCGACSWRCG